MKNKTISVQILTVENDDENDATCQYQAGLLMHQYVREKYVHTPGRGSHKLHTDAKSRNDARKICNEESGHLAIINSRAEEAVLVEMLNKNKKHIRSGSNTEEAFLGIHDMFKDEWVTLFGEPLYSTGYAHWSYTYWGGQPDNKDKNQNCVVLIYKGRMDDAHCHGHFAFFCELPLNCAT